MSALLISCVYAYSINTGRYAQASAANPKNRWFLSGQDHPKIFIAWDKHPHFDNKYTADLGWIAQSVNTAFRSDDWWHFVEPRTLFLSLSPRLHFGSGVTTTIYLPGIGSLTSFVRVFHQSRRLDVRRSSNGERQKELGRG